MFQVFSLEPSPGCRAVGWSHKEITTVLSYLYTAFKGTSELSGDVFLKYLFLTKEPIKLEQPWVSVQGDTEAFKESRQSKGQRKVSWTQGEILQGILGQSFEIKWSRKDIVS